MIRRSERVVSEEGEEIDGALLERARKFHEWKERKDREKNAPKSILQLPKWRRQDVSASLPPHDLYATTVAQKDDLLRAKATYPRYCEDVDSRAWLETHGVVPSGLAFESLLARCVVTRTTDVATGSVARHISVTETALSEFESQLNFLIEAVVHRIHSFLIGSRKLFGIVKGKRVALVLDASDANLGFGRLQGFQNSLLHLVDEQLISKANLFAVAYGTNAACLWPRVRQVDGAIVDETRLWISGLKPKGGANVLAALKEVAKRATEFDAVLLVLGATPDQSADIVVDFFLQASAGRSLPVHAVSFDALNESANVFCRSIAEATGGRFHCYSGVREELIYESTDIAVLLDEIRTASEILSKTSRMRSGSYRGAIVSVESPGAKEAEIGDNVRGLPRPPGHDGPLRVETPSFQARTSNEWLREHGLRGKGLNLYQVLAPDAYAPMEKFVPSIRKSVASQVNAEAMTPFTWHDGTRRNIHVNLPAVHEYQKKLEAAVLLYKRRMDWLTSGSRAMAGTLAEPRVMIVIDVSGANLNYAIHLQHAMRLILEQQMANKKAFNIIAFGGRPRFWQPDFVPVNEETLQSAWSWILGLVFHGSRNTLAALRMAMENRFFEESLKECGIYLVTTGIPDQDPELIASYLCECCLGRPILVHVVYFNVDDFDCGGTIPGRYASVEDTAHALRDIAHSTGGRFHWFKGTSAMESDDMKLISSEIEKAIHFGTKASIIVDAVKNRPRKTGKSPRGKKAQSEPLGFKASPVPSFVRRRNSVAPSVSSSASSTSNRRPKSATSPASAVVSTNRGSAGKRPHSAKVFRSHSFSNGIAKYAFKVSGIAESISEIEETLTSKQWLKRYSLKKLKIDLHHLFHGLDCNHDNLYVKSLGKSVSARFCSIFPVVNVGGSIKHLQLTRKELSDYERELELVLRRYVKRIAWLMSGSHRIFGVVVHKRVNVLIDVSGSMNQNLPDLKRDLTSLIWDQLHARSVAFNLTAFSGSSCHRWRDAVAPASQADCHDAVSWVAELQAEGGTPTLEALKMALEDRRTEAIYMLTDGKPDTSMAKVLSEVARLNEAEANGTKRISINTISFNCDDHEANSFLENLAKDSKGRFHSSYPTDNTEIDLWCHKMLEEDGFASGEAYPRLPEIVAKSDDLSVLGREIQIGRRFLDQSRNFSYLLKNAAPPHEKNMEYSTEKMLKTKASVPS